MINKVVKEIKEILDVPPESGIGYVLCTNARNNKVLRDGEIYGLAKDTYLDDCEYYVDLIIDGSTLKGFYAHRFEHLSTEEVKKHVKRIKSSTMEILKEFE